MDELSLAGDRVNLWDRDKVNSELVELPAKIKKLLEANERSTRRLTKGLTKTIISSYLWHSLFEWILLYYACIIS